MNEAAEYLPATNTTSVAEFNEFQAQLMALKAKYSGVVYDLDDPEQNKRARSDRLAIGKIVAKLDRVHKAVKAPLKEKVDLLDGERKRIKDELTDLQAEIKTQLAEHEAAIVEYLEALQAKADEILQLGQFTAPPVSDDVRERLEELDAIAIDETFGEKAAEAALNKESVGNILRPMLAGLIEQEKAAAAAEQARIEAEQKAQKEREEQIAREAREQAEREAAEAAERAKREAQAAAELAERQAAERLEQDRIAREEAEQAAKEAKAQAERAAIEAAERAERERVEAVEAAKREAAAEAERKEAERLAAIEAERADEERRQADRAHRAKVEEEATAALRAHVGPNKQDAEKVVEMIAKGYVPGVRLKY